MLKGQGQIRGNAASAPALGRNGSCPGLPLPAPQARMLWGRLPGPYRGRSHHRSHQRRPAPERATAHVPAPSATRAAERFSASHPGALGFVVAI